MAGVWEKLKSYYSSASEDEAPPPAATNARETNDRRTIRLMEERVRTAAVEQEILQTKFNAALKLAEDAVATNQRLKIQIDELKLQLKQLTDAEITSEPETVTNSTA